LSLAAGPIRRLRKKKSTLKHVHNLKIHILRGLDTMLVTNGRKNMAGIAARVHPHSMKGARNMKSKKSNMRIAKAKEGDSLTEPRPPQNATFRK